MRLPGGGRAEGWASFPLHHSPSAGGGGAREGPEGIGRGPGTQACPLPQPCAPPAATAPPALSAGGFPEAAGPGGCVQGPDAGRLDDPLLPEPGPAAGGCPQDPREGALPFPTHPRVLSPHLGAPGTVPLSASPPGLSDFLAIDWDRLRRGSENPSRGELAGPLRWSPTSSFDR